jgi:hypothetical protein
MLIMLRLPWWLEVKQLPALASALHHGPESRYPFSNSRSSPHPRPRSCLAPKPCFCPSSFVSVQTVLPSLTYRHPLAPNIPQPIRVITCQKQQWNTLKCIRSDRYLRLIPGTCEVPLEMFRLTSNIHKAFLQQVGLLLLQLNTRC